MEAVIEYFSNMPTAHRSAVLIGGLTIFFLIENAAPLFQKEYSKTKHSGLNIFFTITTIVINFLMAFMLVNTADWVVANNFGLLQWLALPAVATMIIGLLLLDFFGAWLAHFTEHKVQWMWQFHVIHHTDQHVDTTTANRHHPGESVIRFAFTILAVLLVGAPMWLVFLYQSMSVALSQFNHSNLKMPKWLDDAILLVFCTPNMHRVHHHYRQPYSDSNYGNIFSFWDKMLGTYLVVDNEKLVYGVDTYMEKEVVESIPSLLKIPFSGHKPHIQYDKEEQL